MASRGGGRGEKIKCPDGDASTADLLLHPELLSREFLQLVLYERKIATNDDEDRDGMTALFVQHVMPLPQRDLPRSRWGRRVERSRDRLGVEHRKRPLVVFDGSSTLTGAIKLKKPNESPAVTDRLKPPPPSASFTNPIRKLTGSHSNCSPPSAPSSTRGCPPVPAPHPRSPTGNGRLGSPAPPSPGSSSSATVTLKRAAASDLELEGTGELKSPEVKKKINHVTWP